MFFWLRMTMIFHGMDMNVFYGCIHFLPVKVDRFCFSPIVNIHMSYRDGYIFLSRHTMLAKSLFPLEGEF